jgi:general secretion pathway protein E
VIDEEAKALIHGAGSEQRLRAHAAQRGMRGLRQDGLRWVFGGVTSLEEVIRVTRET